MCVLLSVLGAGSFFSLYGDSSIDLWVLNICLCLLLIICTIGPNTDFLVVVMLFMVCCKRSHTEDLDAKVFESITIEVKRLNKTTNFGLVWRNPKNQLWIYVTIPENRL